MRSHVFINIHFKKTPTPPSCWTSRIPGSWQIPLLTLSGNQDVTPVVCSSQQSMLPMQRLPTSLLQTTSCNSWIQSSSSYCCSASTQAKAETLLLITWCHCSAWLQLLARTSLKVQKKWRHKTKKTPKRTGCGHLQPICTSRSLIIVIFRLRF